MNHLSVVIITLNEERNIGRCLQSVEGLADDVVVVDSGSTDRTADICREHGARFFAHPWKGFAETKNFANSLARYPLILSLDADEAVSEELFASIMSVKENPTPAAYSMNRLTSYCGQWIRHCGWYPDKKIRLFHRDEARWTGDLIHEKLTPTDETKVHHLKGDLLHHSYYTVEEHIAQANRFTSLSALEAHRKGSAPGLMSLMLKPVIRFIRDYFVKQGFLDGYYGYIVCRISAQATFFKYAKIRQLNREAKLQRPAQAFRQTE